jgi:hypothetical protein
VGTLLRKLSLAASVAAVAATLVLAVTVPPAGAQSTASKDLYWREMTEAEVSAVKDAWHCSLNWGDSQDAVRYIACVPTNQYYQAQAVLIAFNASYRVTRHVEGNNLSLRYTNGNYAYVGYHCRYTTLSPSRYAGCFGPTHARSRGAAVFSSAQVNADGELHTAYSETVEP